ncbi:hypothetical protein [Xanthomonas sp. 60]
MSACATTLMGLLRCAVLLPCLACTAAGASELGAEARAKAHAWLGRDASELLLQLRVDGGRVQIVEDEQTQQTRYTWSTNTPAWTERVRVSGGDLLGVTVQNNVQIPHFTPIVYDEIHHPLKHRCDITYIADSEGVIRQWDYSGTECDQDIVGPSSTSTPH